MRPCVAVVGVFALITGCGDGYRTVDGALAYQTWDEGNGTRTTYLENADAESFEVLSHREFAKDENNVYFRGVRVWDADPKTFQLLKYPYAKDANRVYALTVPVPTTDVESFEVLLGSPGLVDRVKPSEIRAEFDQLIGVVETMPEDQDVYVGVGWARDGKFCYFGPYILIGADPQTFEAIDEWYAKDANNVYYGRRIISGADPASFRSLGTLEAVDVNHRYLMGEPSH